MKVFPMKALASVLVLATVTACTAYQPRETIFNPNAPTMKSIYNSASSAQQNTHQQALISDNPNAGEGSLRSYTRDATREAQQLFPKIPNPTLVMYVFPHLSAGQVPVPGFSTPFTVYTTTHYALPGELR